ncbi:MAG: T9SS type A sorting domain-containing protein [Ignavibacterium sp.]|nr:MAG: T9SS type A sorting domain-containing protein [Ignavibacterium sp.]
MNRKSLYISAIIILLSFFFHIYPQGTWEKLGCPTDNNLNSVHFVDSLYGWAVGDSGIIIHTSNGGVDWDFQNSSTLNQIVEVFFLNKNLGWAASWNVSAWPFGTLVLKTTNGGQTWSHEPYAEDNIFLQCILFTDSMNGWMGGKPHALIKTADGGVTWEQADIDTSLLAFFPVSNIHFYNSQYGYACGGAFEFAGVIWNTTNGGDSWSAIDVSFAPADPVAEIHVFDSLNVIGIGGDFELFGVGTIRTTDGGNFWEYEEHGIPGVGTDLDFRTDYEAWAPVPSGESLVYSLDSGLSWTGIPAPDSSSIAEINFPDSLHGYAVGDRGMILKYNPPYIIPIELISFTGSFNGDVVTLIWYIATETNNQGFELERRVASRQSLVGNWETLAYIDGHGTTTEPQSYLFTDSKIEAGNYWYRLKQIDFNGTFEYFNEILVEVTNPLKYVLEQNYPNPFNPNTLIKYSVPIDGLVTIEVFNLLGEKVAILVNEIQVAGRYEIDFDASDLSSGIYVYSIKSGNFNSLKKMLLIK